jgi:hypothetical protein
MKIHLGIGRKEQKKKKKRGQEPLLETFQDENGKCRKETEGGETGESESVCVFV